MKAKGNANKNLSRPAEQKPSPLHPSESYYVKNLGGSITAPLLKKYTYRVTETVKNAIKGNIHADPVAKQYIPQDKELITHPEENPDPIGDNAYTPVKGIVHRYPDRVLFKPANVCAVYCRYCFRREAVGEGAEILNANERADALNYIRNHPEIWEVILTGGDPLVLSPRQLGEIIQDLNTIDHVKIIRLHSRVPIADPARVTTKLINTLANADIIKPVYIALHINHAQEITQDVRRAIQDLHRAGISLLSQSVLLKGVNDNPDSLADLYRELVALHVKPYYLHHPDLAPGTSHFRLTIAEGQKIIKALRGKISGLCQPTYMLDIPDGHGKIPLTPCYLTELEKDTYTVENYKGESFHYPPRHKTCASIKEN